MLHENAADCQGRPSAGNPGVTGDAKAQRAAGPAGTMPLGFSVLIE